MHLGVDVVDIGSRGVGFDVGIARPGHGADEQVGVPAADQALVVADVHAVVARGVRRREVHERRRAGAVVVVDLHAHERDGVDAALQVRPADLAVYPDPAADARGEIGRGALRRLDRPRSEQVLEDRVVGRVPGTQQLALEGAEAEPARVHPLVVDDDVDGGGVLDRWRSMGRGRAHQRPDEGTPDAGQAEPQGRVPRLSGPQLAERQGERLAGCARAFEDPREDAAAEPRGGGHRDGGGGDPPGPEIRSQVDCHAERGRRFRNGRPRRDAPPEEHDRR
jgi:hypothetical protein